MLPSKIKQIENDRKKLILQMLNEKKTGSKTKNYQPKRRGEFNCETLE